MKALLYSVCPVGWATCKWLQYFWPGCLTSRLSGLTLRDVPVPELPGEDWVLVRTLLGGICGSDLALLAQKQPPDSILQAYSSQPMGLGHENVAVVERVGSAVDPAWKGKRVCVEPTLACAARGIDPPCPRCAAGEFGACENFAADGAGTSKLPAGVSIGYNRRTGGAFGEFFVAHAGQLVEVPAALSDEQAVLTDPLGCGLHAALRTDLSECRRVLVYGAGVLGLAVIAGLRAIGYDGHIDALARRRYLAETAARLGANDFLVLPQGRRERFEAIAARTGASVQRARFGNYMLSGGYDAVFECAGSRRALDECLKWTRSRGRTVMVATNPGGGVDLSPIWFAELTVVGAYGRQVESFGGRRVATYPLVHELMAAGTLDAAGLLTHTFPVAEYRRAFQVGLHKAAHEAIKVAFDFRA